MYDLQTRPQRQWFWLPFLLTYIKLWAKLGKICCLVTSTSQRPGEGGGGALHGVGGGENMAGDLKQTVAEQ